MHFTPIRCGHCRRGSARHGDLAQKAMCAAACELRPRPAPRPEDYVFPRAHEASRGGGLHLNAPSKMTRRFKCGSMRMRHSTTEAQKSPHKSEAFDSLNLNLRELSLLIAHCWTTRDTGPVLATHRTVSVRRLPRHATLKSSLSAQSVAPLVSSSQLITIVYCILTALQSKQSKAKKYDSC